MITDTRTIPRTAVEQTFFWIKRFAQDWHGEVPLKIHERTAGGLGAAPPFTHEFNSYIGRLTCKNDHCHECTCKSATCIRCQDRRRDEAEFGTKNRLHKSRTTRAFRKLRDRAPREFDVLYLICQQGLSMEEVVARLNDRFERKGFTDRVDVGGVLVLAMSGTDKLKDWY